MSPALRLNSHVLAALDILRVPTAPRHEDLVAAFIRNRVSQLGIPFREDRYGNLIARLRARGARQAVAFSVHMDHPGFEVRGVSGRHLDCDFLGGVPAAFFAPGTPVEFFDMSGAVTGLATIRRVVAFDRRRKRIGLRLESGSVARGAFGMWSLPSFRRKARLVVSRACDDLAGCAAVLGMLSTLVAKRAKADVFALFTRREEIGLEGAFELSRARAIPRSVPIISIETSKALPNAPQGDGPIARVGDRSSIFDPAVTQRLLSVARRMQETNPRFCFQRKLMDGGTCEATAFLDRGYSAGGMCVALGNYHNCGPRGRIAAENIHLDDWRGLVDWMVAAARDFSK